MPAFRDRLFIVRRGFEATPFRSFAGHGSSFFFVRVCAGRERVEISSVLYSRFFKRSRNLQQSEHYFFVQEERTDDRLTLTGGGRLYVILNGNM
jgi:hypothetical protein